MSLDIMIELPDVIPTCSADLQGTSVTSQKCFFPPIYIGLPAGASPTSLLSFLGTVSYLAEQSLHILPAILKYFCG